jgi:hypothetical protein
MPPGERLANPLTERLVAVVRSIGIEVRATTLSRKTFLSGLEIRHSAIPLDEARSRYAGGIPSRGRRSGRTERAVAFLRHELRAANGGREARHPLP